MKKIKTELKKRLEKDVRMNKNFFIDYNIERDQS